MIDLLPDREAATVAAWLKDRPGVDIVARDRAGAYADGIRQGAPDAVQCPSPGRPTRRRSPSRGAACQSASEGGPAIGRDADRSFASVEADRRTAGKCRVPRVDWKTIRGWLQLGRAPLWKQPPCDSILDPFKPFLGRRWSEGCRNAVQLWRELLALGFRGGASVVRDGPPGTVVHIPAETIR